jgi:hypothetical protein
MLMMGRVPATVVMTSNSAYSVPAVALWAPLKLEPVMVATSAVAVTAALVVGM